jgi:RHS repeat-associated protein
MFNVILETGELCFDAIDFALPGFIPIIFARAYRSFRNQSGRLGFGWSWPWEIRLRRERDSYVFDIDGGVIQETFEPKKLLRGMIISDGGATLTILPDRLTLKRTDGFTYHFPHVDSIQQTALVTKIEDVHGNHLLLQNYNSCLREILDTNNRKFHLHYDVSDRITGIDLIAGKVPDSPMRLVTYEYDFSGDLVRVVDRCGASTEYHYVDHLLVALRNRTGGWFFAQYDTQRRCVRHWRGDHRFITHLSFDDTRQQVLVTNALGHSTLFRLNDRGQVAEEIELNGNRILSAYDQEGGLLATVNDQGTSTCLKIEVSDLEQKVIMVDSSAYSITQQIDLQTGTRRLTDASGGVWCEEYNEDNLLLRKESPLGAVSTYQYDTRGVLIGYTEPNGRTTHYQFAPDYRSVVIRDDLGDLEVMQWDTEGRMVECRMAQCNAEQFDYDPLGRLVRVKQPNGGTLQFLLDAEGQLAGFIDATGAETHFELSPYGDVLSQTDPLGRRCRWEYDVLGRVVCLWNAANEEMCFEYNSMGRMISQRFFDGRTERYAYDVLGQLCQIHHSDGTLTQLEYDAVGRILSIIGADNDKTLFEYDEQGRCVLADQAGVIIRFAYDADGRFVTEEQDGIQLERAYDANGNCVTLRVQGLGARSYVYDQRSRLVEAVDFDGTRLQLQYDLRDRCVSVRGPGTTRLEFEYLPENRLAACRLVGTAGLHQVRYNYDIAGRVSERSMTDRDPLHYTYDPASRLHARHRHGTMDEFYFNTTDDLVTNADGTSRMYRPGSAIRASGGSQFERDSRGRITVRNDRRGQTRYFYDGHDRLSRVLHPDGVESRYIFDAYGRRLWKAHGETETRFIWDNDTMIAEVRDHLSVPAAVYFTEPHTYVPLTMTRQGERGIFLAERTGYPLLFVDEHGHELSDEPHPWGCSTLPDTALSQQPLRFAGQYYDVETGLHYNRYRFYDPNAACYVTPDPIGINAGLNIYHYVVDPVNTFDPQGLQTAVVSQSCLNTAQPQPRSNPPATMARQCNPSRGTSIHNDCINRLRNRATAAGLTTRADQTMEYGSGNNRPDLVIGGGSSTGQDVYVEFDYAPAQRAQGHLNDICQNHPGAMVVLVTIPQPTRYSTNAAGATPNRRGNIPRTGQNAGPSDQDCGIDQMRQQGVSI